MLSGWLLVHFEEIWTPLVVKFNIYSTVAFEIKTFVNKTIISYVNAILYCYQLLLIYRYYCRVRRTLQKHRFTIFFTRGLEQVWLTIYKHSRARYSRMLVEFVQFGIFPTNTISELNCNKVIHSCLVFLHKRI